MRSNAFLSAGIALASVAQVASLELLSPAPIAHGNYPDGYACGAFDVPEGSPVTEWPVRGHDVHAKTEIAGTYFGIDIALLRNTEQWTSLDMIRASTAGEFCWGHVEGTPEAWVGEDALLQVWQYNGEGHYEYEVGPSGLHA